MNTSSTLDRAKYNREWRVSPRGVFTDQRQNAYRRGIEWLLTFEQWLAIWGDKLVLRGRGSDDYCMARNGDTGPYAVGNVRIVTGRNNRGETTGRKKEGWNRRRASRNEAPRYAMENC